MDKKLILSDCDGVMIDWEGAFREWMTSQGHRLRYSDSYKLHHHFHDMPEHEIDRYVNDFCASEAIADLMPYPDAQEYIEKLYKTHGYRIRVITSIGNDPEIRERRTQNLNNLFGDAIESVVCLAQGSPKDLILGHYQGTGLYWIEDNYNNFLAGVKLGLEGILMDQEYNRDSILSHGHRVSNWREIYGIISRTPE